MYELDTKIVLPTGEGMCAPDPKHWDSLPFEVLVSAGTRRSFGIRPLRLPNDVKQVAMVWYHFQGIGAMLQYLHDCESWALEDLYIQWKLDIDNAIMDQN